MLPTVSMAVLALVHTPPVVASDKSIPGPPRETVDGPKIGVTVGVVFTVTTAVTLQAVAVIYVMVVVPLLTPVTAPDPDIVATAGELLVHDMPGVVASLTKVTRPVHTERVPLMAAGAGFTVITSIFMQPVLLEVKVMPAVPAATPVTLPDPSIVALVLVVLQ